MEKNISESTLELHKEYNRLYSKLKKEYIQFITDAIKEFGGEDKCLSFDYNFETENISILREGGWEMVYAVYLDKELNKVMVDMEYSTDEIYYLNPDELAMVAGAVVSYLNRDHDEDEEGYDENEGWVKLG